MTVTATPLPLTLCPFIGELMVISEPTFVDVGVGVAAGVGAAVGVAVGLGVGLGVAVGLGLGGGVLVGVGLA